MEDDDRESHSLLKNVLGSGGDIGHRERGRQVGVSHRDRNELTLT